MKDIVIVGYGGLARECAFLISEINRQAPEWNLLGHIAPKPESIGQAVGRHHVWQDDSWLEQAGRELNVVLALGHPPTLRALHQRFSPNKCLHFPVIAHPSVTADWQRVQVGQGTILFNGVALTTDVSIGEFNIVNPGCTVSHDCVLGSYNLLGPGVHLAGAVTLGSGILLGTGAQVLPGIRISDAVTIGAGAVVCNSISEEGIYAGVPAKRLKKGSAR